MTQMAQQYKTMWQGRGWGQTSGCDMKYWFLKDAIMTVLPQQGLQFAAYLLGSSRRRQQAAVRAPR